MDKNEKFMHKALCLANQAAEDGEVPVGCVIVHHGEIIGQGRNRCEKKANATKHAEMEAIDQASKVLGNWRLEDCDMYVTLEPCPMCAGAIINSRIGKIYIGTKDNNIGACGSVLNIFEERFGHHPAIYSGILQDECSRILSSFFVKLRNK